MPESTEEALQAARQMIRRTARAALAEFLVRWGGGTGEEQAAWDLAARISDVYTLYSVAEVALIGFLDRRRRGDEEMSAVASTLEEVERLSSPVSLLEESDPPRVALTPGASRVVRIMQKAQWRYQLAVDLRYMVNARYRRDLPSGLPSRPAELVPALAARYRAVTEDAITTFLSFRKHCKYDIPFARMETVIGFHTRLDRFTAGMAVSTLCQYRAEFGYSLRSARTATVREIEQMAAAGLEAAMLSLKARTAEDAEEVVRIIDGADETVRQRHLELAARRPSRRRRPSGS